MKHYPETSVKDKMSLILSFLEFEKQFKFNVI